MILRSENIIRGDNIFLKGHSKRVERPFEFIDLPKRSNHLKRHHAVYR
jgi:hypothetical protein